MFISGWVGRKAGRRQGVAGTISYLIQMDVCTTDDLHEAQERFEKHISDKDDD
tara:strand:- start:559 stop:717 length:159 start_codon:yes stop_codon:yes gene_type:complete